MSEVRLIYYVHGYTAGRRLARLHCLLVISTTLLNSISSISPRLIVSHSLCRFWVLRSPPVTCLLCNLLLPMVSAANKLDRVKDRAPFEPIAPDLDVDNLISGCSNFHAVERVDARTITEETMEPLRQLIQAHVIEGGKPLVLENWHQRSDWPRWIFNPDWLRGNHGMEGSFHFVPHGGSKNFVNGLSFANIGLEQLSMSEIFQLNPTCP